MESSWEKLPWFSLLLGFAMVVVWGLISIAHAHERSLARVNDCFVQGLMAVDGLDSILDDLARLDVDEGAFFSTNDPRLQDGVIESTERLTLHIGMLNSIADRYNLQRPLVADLSRSISQVLGSIGESDGIAAVRGRAAAAAFFESKEAEVAEAREQASHLKVRITAGISNKIQNARTTGSFLRDLIYVAPANGIEHGARRIRIDRVATIP
jgi:hypothetical protein